MSKSTNPPRSSARRDELLAVAARVFAEKGFSNSTVRDLGEEAGILSGSLYHHFESKDAILEDLLHGLFDEIEQSYLKVFEAGNPPDQTIRDLLVTGYGFLDRRANEISVLNNDLAYISQLPRLAFVAERTQRLERFWIATIKSGVECGQFRTDIDPEVAYRIMMGSLVSAVRWYNRSGPLDAAQLGGRVADIFLGGLLGAGEGDASP